MDDWYGFTFKKADDSDFDLGGADSADLRDYFVIAEQMAMNNDNRFAPNASTAANRLSSETNLYLPADTQITFKSGTVATYWAISLNGTAVSNTQDYKTHQNGSAWTNQSTFTVSEAGYYGFTLKNDDQVLDPEAHTLFDFFTISGYDIP